MERLGVVVHPTRRVLDSVELLEDWTKGHGLDLVQIRSAEQPSIAPSGVVDDCDLIVALGGDGTILNALHVSAGTRTPVLGVAYGSLGALTALPAEELRPGLDQFLAGDWRADQLPALAVHVGAEQIASAINDVVLARGRGTQLMLDVRLRGELYVRLAGDGIALATPLGSSAYSMAAGGPLLADGIDAFVCTPLAMHGGCAPPLVVGGAQAVTIDVHPGYSGFYMDVDGAPVDTAARRFEVTRQHAYATLVRLGDSPAGVSRLRARGLIRDSPRVIRQRQLAAASARG